MLFPIPKSPHQRHNFLIGLWQECLASPLGIKIECTSPTSLRQQLYAARKEAQIPALADLSIIVTERFLYILPPRDSNAA